MEKMCGHRDEIKEQVPASNGCEECLKTGDTWVELRMCLSCGHVGCCNSSNHKHASKHFLATGHPLIKSVTNGEPFIWCYIDEVYLPII